MTEFPEIVPSKKMRNLDLSNNFITSLENLYDKKFPQSDL